ncbi:hypothetical protein PQ455_09300 [Sphingomonas naphthae]|uniref:Uncharacterized protein n=1 Tax=Sphingomonas naphthae TaxID=1813468 RepID=A0ABY7TFZ6_9SPHN|nr:hypothetical protein [Sphingomonas naphthae]WCT71850.1 hypothetical protein PQ455_09300 [Sphingomonas naphthae]
MAYMDFNAGFGIAQTQSVTAQTARPAPAATRPRFSALEWTVIAMARREGLRSIGTPSRLARALGGLFGFGSTSRLADSRLEALRRAAIHAWARGPALPVAERAAFIDAGFTPDHLEALIASVSMARVSDYRGAIA